MDVDPIARARAVLDDVARWNASCVREAEERAASAQAAAERWRSQAAQAAERARELEARLVQFERVKAELRRLLGEQP